MALLHVDFFSDVLRMTTQMEVILPQPTAENPTFPATRADGTYPVLYLLHGMHDTSKAWIRQSSIERYAEKLGIAVVMPTTYLGWYTDMAHGLKYWTFISQELPRICRSFFPNISAKREDTFAAGLSMGGYGALKCGLLAPETFSAVASLSGAVHMELALTEEAAAKDSEESRGFWTDIFGPPAQFKNSANDLYAAAEVLTSSGKKRPDIFMWCGTEDFLYAQNTAMRDRLKTLGYNITYEESPGDHQWVYWDKKIQTVLDWLPLVKKG